MHHSRVCGANSLCEPVRDITWQQAYHIPPAMFSDIIGSAVPPMTDFGELGGISIDKGSGEQRGVASAVRHNRSCLQSSRFRLVVGFIVQYDSYSAGPISPGMMDCEVTHLQSLSLVLPGKNHGVDKICVVDVDSELRISVALIL